MKKIEPPFKEVERAVDEVFKGNGISYKAVASGAKCDGCCFIDAECWRLKHFIGSCVSVMRKDKQNVVFVELEIP